MTACAEKYDQVYQCEQYQRYKAIRREGCYIPSHVLLALQELIDGDACHGCRWKPDQPPASSAPVGGAAHAAGGITSSRKPPDNEIHATASPPVLPSPWRRRAGPWPPASAAYGTPPSGDASVTTFRTQRLSAK